MELFSEQLAWTTKMSMSWGQRLGKTKLNAMADPLLNPAERKKVKKLLLGQ